MSKLTVQFSPLTALLRGGFDRIEEFIDREEFTFVVNSKSFVVPMTEAILISSKVYDSVRCDASVRSFRIESSDATSDDFSQFLDFVRDSSLESVDLETGLKFLSFCRLLGSDSLSLVLLALIHPIRPVSLTPGFPFGTPSALTLCEADVDYCASLFYLYSVQELRALNHDLLHRILGSPALHLRTEDGFLRLLLGLGADFAEFVNYVEISTLSESGFALFVDGIEFANLTPIIWAKIGKRLKGFGCEEVPAPRFAGPSMILGPDLDLSVLHEFEKRPWKLLYRGSEHGFRFSDFHAKCDQCSNTVAVILTTTGCIFGGFTPLAWDSTPAWKSDSAKRSFLFQIKDSRNSGPRKFSISKPSLAIYCNTTYGLTFGNGHDLYVADCCNQNAVSYTNLGSAYVNDTGLKGEHVFTGERHFTVKEIEVFSISE
jgi:hypothetical protein